VVSLHANGPGLGMQQARVAGADGVRGDVGNS
jgi:hypothetical protein